MKLKSMFYTLSSLTLTSTPLLFVTSCGSQSSSTDIGNLKEYFNDELRNAISNKAKEINEGNDNNKKALLNQNIIQITAGGKVNDRSFNQLTKESMEEFTKLVGTKYTFLESESSKEEKMNDVYNSALRKSDEFKIWILTGFSQAKPFSAWIKNNKQEIINKNIKIVAIDWDATNVDSEIKGNFLSLNYRTQESSFLAGYCIARFLGENYSGAQNKDKRIFNTSSGADKSGSTNFNYGFLTGIKAWNDEQQSDDTKVYSNIYNSTNKVWLDTKYTANSPEKIEDFKYSIKGNGINVFKEKTPTIVMPVAADWSKTAVDIIKSSGNTDKQWVVGVDTNMAISYGSAFSKYFITSAEKRIGVTLFQAINFLTGISSEINNPNLSLATSEWTMDAATGKISKNGIAENLGIKGGLDLGFVGLSKSSISNKTLASKFDNYAIEAKNKFFGQSGKLKQNLEANIQKFNEALNTNDISVLNKAIFDINNVLACEVTEGNQEFFNNIVDDINKWLSNK